MRYARVWRVGGIGAVATAVAVLAWGSPGQAELPVASAALVDINGAKVGSAVFTPNDDGSVKGRLTMVIDNTVAANPAEFHGFHIHANNDDDTADGNVNDGCVTHTAGSEPTDLSKWFFEADSHWDVGGHSHGSHTGDLPSLIRQSDGAASIQFTVDKLTAQQLPGKALIVHFLADDFGKHSGVGTSTTTGNAGFRYACGLIVPSAQGR